MVQRLVRETKSCVQNAVAWRRTAGDGAGGYLLHFVRSRFCDTHGFAYLYDCWLCRMEELSIFESCRENCRSSNVLALFGVGMCAAVAHRVFVLVSSLLLASCLKSNDET